MVNLACRTLQHLAICLGTHRILIVWLIFICIVFVTSYLRHKNDPKYHYVREMAGVGLYISRATAHVVNVSTFFAILPMCRLFMTYLRNFGSKISASCVSRTVDNCKLFHVICALTIILSGGIHSVAHMFNVLNFSLHYNHDHKNVNIAKFKGEDPLLIVMCSVAGVSGILMVLVLGVLSAASTKYMRDTSYDLFWLTHHLFIVFLILLVCHPMSGLLKEQVNVFSHPVGCLMNKFQARFPTNEVLCTEAPAFISHTSATWKWVLAGLTVYMVDLVFRLLRRKDPVRLLDFQIYECNMIRLNFVKKDFTPKPGQIVYLQCSEISRLEWHPFSISRCPSPEDMTFTLHLRTLGDWSDKLKHRLSSFTSETNVEKMNGPNEMSWNLKFYIDGPYGSCFEEILHHSVSICIAGGIGFTPFASVLSYLRLNGKKHKRIQRLHFIWICRDLELYACFSNLLYDTFQQVRNSSPDKFELYLHFTRRTSWNAIECALGHSYPFLKPRIQLGKPCWNFLFEQWAMSYKKSNVGLFCCGPKKLNQSISQLSEKWNLKGCNFVLHEETF